jgi:glycosyltransferase involved in cell wall biosynthesis/ribosomal protein S18 acetylase RimI-like enzyme
VSRPIRVAHVASLDATVRFLLMAQLTRLRDEGYEVAAISASGPWVRDLEAEGIRHVDWPHVTRAWDPAADARAFRALLAILRRERFDLVHTHNPKPGVMGRVAARMAGVPCVVNTIHGLYASPEDPPGRRMAILAAERLAARCSDLELFQSAEDLAWARSIGLVRRSRSALLGNGVDLVRFDPKAVSAERAAAVREELGIPPGAVVVVTVGRLVAEKGYRDLVTAAEAVRHADPEARFVAVGPGDPAKSDAIPTSELARARELVLFTGWRDDVRDLLAATDIFVLPSWREGVPRSAIEAAAMGLPLVLSDIRGCREVARDGREGFLVPPRDPGSLASAILRLAEDADLRRRFGGAARERAVERFDERRVTDTLVHRYRRLVEAKGLAGTEVEVQGVGTVEMRAGRPGDEGALARYHAQHRSAFLPVLGEGFLRRFYLAQIEDPGASVVVAERGGRVVGFCTGVVSMSGFMRRFALRHGLPAALAAGPRLLRPEVARRLIETIRYPAKLEDLPEAELVFAAVDPGTRTQRLGGLLTRRVVDELGALGADEVRVFISVDNEPSTRMITRLGFQPRGGVVVHEGERSKLYIMRCRSS